MAIIASSSSVAAFQPKRYDVFISFRGEDTRRNFTSHLRDALRGNRIETYMDDKLNQGDEIWPTLSEAIEESHISIIVFSENYASSKWCLEELVKILECKNEKGQDVIPVFYNVDPSDVRKQRGSYKKAFAKRKRDFEDNQHKLTKWKHALSEAANLAGLDSRVHEDDSKLINEIVKDVLRKLKYKYPPMESKCPFGINENLAPIESLLREVQTIGIWGMGGIGKTTIAKWLFNKYSSQYEGSYFLPNIRENSQKHGHALYDLRNELVSKLLGEDERTINGESTFVWRRLCCKRVFIVLDDVSASKQLEYLVGELQCCGSGSKIIVTTRDKHVLSKGVDVIHTVKALNSQESSQLFSLKAFNQNEPREGYKELSKRAVDYSKGLPLALEVLGSFLHSKTEDEWESALKKLRRIPHEGIQSILIVSYDGLNDEEKEMLLDIACFLKGDNAKHVISLLESYGFCANIGLRSLKDKSLITIENGVIWMHDLIQEMGWEIVRQESTIDPGRRSRLWDPKEVYDVLKNNEGTDAVQGISLDMSRIKDIYLSVDTFRKMTNLRFFRFYSSSGIEYSSVHLPISLHLFSNRLRHLGWFGYPSKTLSLTFCPEKLVELRMRHSHLEKLWDGVQDFVNLKIIDLGESKWLIELPDFSKAQKLEDVHLCCCESLCHVHPSLLSLHSLITLNLRGCKELKSLESEIHLRSLKHLDVSHCSSLERFSVSSEKIEFLDLSDLRIEILSPSIGRLSKLKVLRLRSLTKLKCLPSELSCLRNLKNLSILGCSRLVIHKQELHMIFDALQSLEKLSLDMYLPELPDNINVLSLLHGLVLSGSNIECLPASIKQLTKLTYLEFSNCKMLRSLPELPQSVNVLDLSGSNIECLPASIKQLTKLGGLDLSGCKMLQSLPELPQSIMKLQPRGSNIECLPASIHQLTRLRELDLIGCKMLQYLPELPQSIKYLYLSGSNIECLPTSIHQLTRLRELDLIGCKMLQSLPELPQSIMKLQLRGSNIDCLPASIHQLTALERLDLSDCKRLRSLPKLPESIKYLDASNCTSMEAGINTRTSTLWKKEHASFLNFQRCVNDFNRRKSARELYMCLAGSRVPEWFKDNRATEASITIKLDRPSQIVAFAFCVVLSPFSDNGKDTYINCYQGEQLSIKILERFWWAVNGELFASWKGSAVRYSNSDHVHLWVQPAYSLPDKRSTCNRTFEFIAIRAVATRNSGKLKYYEKADRDIRIKECGIFPLYMTQEGEPYYATA